MRRCSRSDLARRFAKHHPVVLDMLEWGFSAGVAISLTIAALIANAREPTETAFGRSFV